MGGDFRLTDSPRPREERPRLKDWAARGRWWRRGCIGYPLLLAAMFCLANSIHWMEVLSGGYPLLYTFPAHSFTVVDADTRAPIEGAMALYVYHSKSMYGGTWDLSPLYDFAGRGLYASFLWIANPLRHENIAWNGKPYIVHLAESVSDAQGRIQFPEAGPFLRRRNNYFNNSGAPVGYLLMGGYAVKPLASDIGNLRAIGWTSFPDWADTTITMQGIDAFAMQKQENIEYFIYKDLFDDRSGLSPPASIPRVCRYLAERAEWRERDFDAKVDALRPY